MKTKQKIPVKALAAGGVVAVSGLLAAGVFVLRPGQEEPAPEVITISTLEKIIHTSELSTYTTAYNGIATVMNEKDPEEVDYYVAYEATVNAGIDFQDCTATLDAANNIILITLPEVGITDVTVDPGSLDYIFVNKKAETATVSSQALPLCKKDATTESESQDALLDFAEENAKNVITALTRPLLEQSGTHYTLVFQTM